MCSSALTARCAAVSSRRNSRSLARSAVTESSPAEAEAAGAAAVAAAASVAVALLVAAAAAPLLSGATGAGGMRWLGVAVPCAPPSDGPTSTPGVVVAAPRVPLRLRAEERRAASATASASAAAASATRAGIAASASAAASAAAAVEWRRRNAAFGVKPPSRVVPNLTELAA